VALKMVAGLVPKSTARAPARLVPVMVTVVPPASAPVAGARLDSTGAGGR
jgi:hypothetical protein